MGPLAAGLIAGGATSVLNGVSDLWANKKNREFSREMYDRTRADNIEFWNMQNAYNTPQEQMKRFSAAGLNPNLIYGSSGDNSAASIPTPDVQPVQFRGPKFDKVDLVGAMLAHADLKIKNAQANNLNEQTEVIRQDAMLRRTQAERAGFDLDFNREFRDVNADALRESVRQRRITTDLAINRDAREAVMNSSNVREAAERILNMIETRKGFAIDRAHTEADTRRIAESIRQMLKDGTIKDFEIMLNRSNMSKGDPLWSRMILDFLSGDSPLKPLKSLPPEMKGFPGPKY